MMEKIKTLVTRVGWIGLAIGAAVLVLAAFGLGYLVHGPSSTSGDEHAAHEHEAGAQTWTCSMHPQIRQPGPGKCPVCGMDLIPVEREGGEAGPRQIHLSEHARALAEIEVASVVRRSLTAEVRLTGKVDYDETRVGYITAWVGGRIDRLHVDFTGEKVRKGQSMVSIYSPELLLAQDELIQAAKMAVSLSDLGGAGSSAIQQTLEASRERLLLWGLTKKQVAAIEQKGKRRKHLTIVAPIGGVVIHKNAAEGMYVEEGTRIYTIADLGSLWIMLDAYESDIAWIRKGQKVEISVEAYPGTTFEGIVSFIDPVINPVTRTARVRVEVENPEGLLKPEMFVHAAIGAEVKPAEEADEPPLVIPASAPLVTGKRAVVYVDVGEGLYEGREVVLGPRAGDHYVVVEGLYEGEKVVVRGSFKIDSAMQIQAKPSMMSPSGGVAPPGHHHGPPPASATEPPSTSHQAPEAFLDQLGGVVDAYLGLHDALAKDDLDGARKAALQIGKALDGTDMKLLEGEAHSQWMKALEAVREPLSGIEKAGDLGEARKDFSPLSEAVIFMVRSFGTASSRVLYLKHCPMAFDSTGANWLQAHPDTRNPYFGPSMLTCAEDVEEFRPSGHGGGHD